VVKATQLGRSFPGDPADRLIVASALLAPASLVTKDEKIRAYPAVDAVW
jgi:PIN domain nuclease of toxin-antitoxin system